MADLYKYQFTYYYGEHSEDTYNGYLYAEEGSYTVRQYIEMEDGGSYRITSISEVEDNDDASAGSVYISSYDDKDGSGAPPYTPDYYELGLAAGTEGLGSESDWIFGTEFGYVNNGDTPEPIAVDVENDGTEVRVIAAMPGSPASGVAINFRPDENEGWVVEDNSNTDGWETGTQYFTGEIVLEFADDPYFDETDSDFLENYLPDYQSFLDGDRFFNYESFNYFDLLEPLIEAGVFAPRDEVHIVEILDNTTQGFSQDYYIVDEGAGRINLDLSEESEITKTVLIIRDNDWSNNFSDPLLVNEIAQASDFTFLVNNNSGANKEENEPLHAGNAGGASVWHTWTATESSLVELNVDASFPELVAIYTGNSLENLTEIVSYADAEGEENNLVSFYAVAGTNYYFAVDSYNDGGEFQTGEFFLEIDLDTSSVPPDELPIPNNNFTDAVSLNKIEALVSADNFDIPNPFYFVWETSNINATKETGETNHAGNLGGASVWYSWTAPESGIISISTEGSDFDTTLGVYTGYSVDNLTTVASNDDIDYTNDILSSEVALEVVAGQTYYIAVDGYNGATGNIKLEINPVEVTFANYTGWVIEDEATFNTEIVVDYFFEDQITDVNVELTLDHSYHADLEVFLVKLDSSGTETERVELFSDIGGRGDGFTTVTLDDEAVDPITGATSLGGTYPPVDSLADLDGQDANGTWVLEITDDAGNDVGFLYDWSITFGFSEVSDTVTLESTTDFTASVEPDPVIS